MPAAPRSLCYVLRSFPEPSETFIADEANSVAARGVRVSVVCLHDGSRGVVHPSSQQLMEQGCMFHIGQPGRWSVAVSLVKLFLQQPRQTLLGLSKALRSPHRWLYFSTLPAAAWCRSRGVDFLHAHFADVNLQAAHALSHWLGRPFGVTTHGYDLRDEPIGHKNAAAAFQASDLLVTISRWNTRGMVERYPLRQEDIHVVHCGVDLEAFAFHSRSFANTGPFRLLNVGRLVPVKAQAVLLRAVAQVRAQGIACQLDIVGGGPLEGELQQLCQELALMDCVTLHGAQAQPFVRARLQQAHAFVLSSTSEGLPVACIEAAATGTPLIATRITGLPELIDDGVSGLLVTPGDAGALAQAIAWAATHRSELPAMAAHARRKVEREFDRTACTRQLLALIGGTSKAAT